MSESVSGLTCAPVRMSIFSLPWHITVARVAVERYCELLGFSERSRSEVALSVGEALANVIKHAYDSSPTEEIDINVKYAKGKLEITIVDSGKHFDPNSVPTPDLKKYVKERKHGGLGMFLMKKLMDEVQYSALPDGRNQLKLIKQI